MNVFGLLVMVAIAAFVVLVVGSPRAYRVPKSWVSVTPGALLGAMFGGYFFRYGPRAGGTYVIPSLVLSFALALVMRLIARTWADSMFGKPTRPAR